MKEVFEVIFASVGACVTYWLGGYGDVLFVLCAFMVCDQITGVSVAIMNKTLESSKGADGIRKKGSMLAVILVGLMLDTLTGSGGVIGSLVVYFYIANEGISVLENAGKLGVPLPPKVMGVLKQLQGEEEVA